MCRFCVSDSFFASFAGIQLQQWHGHVHGASEDNSPFLSFKKKRDATPVVQTWKMKKREVFLLLLTCCNLGQSCWQHLTQIFRRLLSIVIFRQKYTSAKHNSASQPCVFSGKYLEGVGGGGGRSARKAFSGHKDRVCDMSLILNNFLSSHLTDHEARVSWSSFY